MLCRAGRGEGAGQREQRDLLPAKKLSVETGVGLPSCISIRVAEGILSPVLIVMSVSVGGLKMMGLSPAG